MEIDCLRSLSLAKSQISGVLDFALPDRLLALDLSHNQISAISEKFVSSLKSVSLINLSYNSISELPDCFPPSLKLNKIFLDCNKLTSLPNSLLNNAIRIDNFSVSSNRLERIETFNFPQLRILNVSMNNLRELPDCFAECNFLTELNVSFNQLEDLPHSLSNCRKTLFIFAAGNLFKSVPRCIFSFCQLKSLVLSGNKLTVLPNSMSSFFFLKSLDLSNNYFQSVPKLIGHLRSLKFFSMSHNALQDIPDDLILPKTLTLVDFSFNRLTKFKCDLPEAKSINLGYNLITEIDLKLFPNVQFLCLSHNKFNQKLIDILGSLCSLQNLKVFEFLGNESGPALKPPPLRFHILSDFLSSANRMYGVGYSATMGERPTMEDSVAIKSYDNRHSIFAIFDGHSGNVSSAIASNCLVREMESVIKFDDDSIAKEFSDCFKRINDKLKLIKVTDGCTTAGVLFRDKHCYIIGVGDSRVVRVRKNSVHRMTVDSKPLIRSEYQRLRDCGLMINNEGRINRKLAVARALGDFWIGDGIFVKPEVNEFTVDDDDFALIVACDGLWDVVTDEMAGMIVRQSQTAADAAVTLKNYAFALGSKDNISVIVIYLNSQNEDCGFVTRNTVDLIEPFREPEEQEDNELGILQINPLPGVRRRRR
ncbi:protein phosphatase 2C [Histomonas meleagridis]|uniref:protein phosphatase 2C n=1 Tax=Histomonas meleagridis TaxID=135588 RepID=UPI00355A91BF|nr:protein phosphatase 2C [Histomonas meleagridis]KAH0802396.1 protein phosphatase 2C [Histomonas meleagridis]